MTSDKPQIILASASPRREHLLREMGLRFVIVRPDGVEELLGGAAPDVLAMQNAQRKARAVAGRHPQSMVIGADTIVVLGGKPFGKPRDRDEAQAMLVQATALAGAMAVEWELQVNIALARRDDRGAIVALTRLAQDFPAAVPTLADPIIGGIMNRAAVLPD